MQGTYLKYSTVAWGIRISQYQIRVYGTIRYALRERTYYKHVGAS